MQSGIPGLLGAAALAMPVAIVSGALVQSFDPSSYAPVDVNGADGGQWFVDAQFVGANPGTQTATVTTTSAYHGTQGLELVDTGTGYLNRVRYNLSPANVTTVGLTNGGNMSWAFKYVSGSGAVGMEMVRSLPDGTAKIPRGGVYLIPFTETGGEVWFYDHDTGTSTPALGNYQVGRWYIANINSHGTGTSTTADLTIGTSEQMPLTALNRSKGQSDCG